MMVNQIHITNQVRLYIEMNNHPHQLDSRHHTQETHNLNHHHKFLSKRRDESGCHPHITILNLLCIVLSIHRPPLDFHHHTL